MLRMLATDCRGRDRGGCCLSLTLGGCYYVYLFEYNMLDEMDDFAWYLFKCVIVLLGRGYNTICTKGGACMIE